MPHKVYIDPQTGLEMLSVNDLNRMVVSKESRTWCSKFEVDLKLEQQAQKIRGLEFSLKREREISKTHFKNLERWIETYTKEVKKRLETL